MNSTNSLFIKTFFTFIFLLSGFISPATAETVFISSYQAKVLQKPHFISESVIYLKKGDRVQVIDKKGSWLKILSNQDKQGWLSRFLVKKTPPNNRVTALNETAKINIQDVRRRTSALTSAAAARGLTFLENAEEDNYQSDVQAVLYMESLIIPPQELNRFTQKIQKANN